MHGKAQGLWATSKNGLWLDPAICLHRYLQGLGQNQGLGVALCKFSMPLKALHLCSLEPCHWSSGLGAHLRYILLWLGERKGREYSAVRKQSGGGTSAQQYWGHEQPCPCTHLPSNPTPSPNREKQFLHASPPK